MASSKTRPDSSLDSDPAPASEEGATRASDAFGPTLQASSIAPGPLSHPLGQEAVTEEQLGRYEVEGELGVGGIGRVNLAYDKHLGRRVALKELHEEQVPRSLGPGLKTVRTPVELRFVNEARITGQLEHPGVVPVYELGRRADGTLYYTMRNVRGRTFEDALATNLRGRLRLLPHFVDLCNTVAYAHSRGVIHRDLKPENVMIGDFGETVVLDWGLAKVRGEKDLLADALEDEIQQALRGSPLRTVAGVPLGTPGYMSPEQARGEVESIDERSDVYALGVVLYQLLTGAIPFDGESAQAVIEQVLNAPAPSAVEVEPNCPAELAAIANRAMEKDPARRYPDAVALAEDVQNFMSGGLVGAHRYTPTALVWRWLVRRRLWVLAVASVVVVGAGTWWYRGVQEDRAQARAERKHVTEVLEQVDRIFGDVAAGNLQERWLEVLTLKLMALRDPVSAPDVMEQVTVALGHPSADVRRLAARTLGGMGTPQVVDALVARLGEGVEASPDVVVEVINALGIIGDPRAEEPVREARRRHGQYGSVWTQTELAYRMIPMTAQPAADLDAAGWIGRGNAFMWKSRFPEALEAFDRAIALEPDSPSAHNNRAIVRKRLGDMQGALADYDAVIQADPSMVMAYNNRALLRRAMGDYEGALSDLDRVVKEGSLGAKALRNRSLVRRYLGDFAGAHEDLQEALALEPNDVRTMVAIGSTWLWARDYRRALEVVDRALLIDGGYSYGILLRARLHWLLGQSVAAVTDTEGVLQLDPMDNQARRMRAVMHMAAGEPEQAKRHLDHCLENQCIHEESRRALRHAQRGVVYYAELRRYPEALADLDRALAARPRHVDAFLYRLATVAIEQRRGAGGVERRLADLAKSLGGVSTWYADIAALLRAEGRYETLDARLIQPLQRCTLALAGGLAAERAGDLDLARQRYREAADAGDPFELSCLLADQAARALGAPHPP